MSARIGLAVALGLLVVGTINVFLVIGADSHSVSDTLRPFRLTMVPLWAVAIYAGRIVLPSEARGC
ncbi:MAG: hypothetical protein ABIP53_06940 [Candidatus Limnocylindrales bacterium]